MMQRKDVRLMVVVGPKGTLVSGNGHNGRDAIEVHAGAIAATLASIEDIAEAAGFEKKGWRAATIRRAMELLESDMRPMSGTTEVRTKP